ncbi:MAG: hypothetical protein CMH27_08075 [Micavibrio sp.]|nr:hypothetical protein [Micavibrio sp.]
MSKIFVPKNTLKEKVGNGGFDEKSIEKAQKSIDDNVVDFAPIAKTYLGKIKTAITEFESQEDHHALYTQLQDQLTQLRAQGSMFQYPAITAITDTVVDLLDSLKRVDAKIIEIVNAYEQSANILIASNVKSDKDKVCRALVLELQKVCDKYKVKYQ